MFTIPKTFWKDMENPEFFKFIVYGDTDSLYINVPDLKPKSTNEAIIEANKISQEINSIIKDYTDNILLEKLNVGKKFNKTEYKTEIIANAMILLDVKKNYALKVIAEKGKIFENEKIEFKGIPIVRVDYSKFTQDLLRKLIVDISLNSKVNMKDELIKVLQEANSNLQKSIDELDFKYFASPGKWKLSDNYKQETYHVIGMKFYNSITSSETFKEGMSGYTAAIGMQNPIQIRILLNNLENNKYYLKNDFDVNKINYLTIPYNYDKLKIQKLLTKFNLIVDFDNIKNIVFSKTINRVIEVILNNNF